MKSIDGAGVEWHLSHPDADKEETWKAGANYVLEVIELYCKEHVVCNTNIKHLIELLKK